MRKTANYDLSLPEGTEAYDIAIVNQNTDKIDIAIKGAYDLGRGASEAVATKAEADDVSAMIKTATNLTVQPSAWENDGTFSDYPFRATLTVPGVTGNHIPDVTFAPTDVMTGKFCPVAGTDTNKVYIYANALSDVAITVLSVVCRKAV